MKSGTLAGITATLLLGSAVARADVEISSKPTSNMSCDAAVCTATAAKAVLNVSDLATMLASGDVAVKTGLVAKAIDIDQVLQWTSTSRLTLDAQASVTVKKQITVAGTGALTVITNDTGGAKAKNKTGEFIIVPERGSVQFWDLSSSLIIDGNSYTLVDDIKTLASDIAANPSGFYALAKPYDASVDGTYTSSPVEVVLQGIFDGLGNEISNFGMNANGSDEADFTGLFEEVGDQGTVQDVGIRKASLIANGDDGALLVDGNLGQIVRCWVRGKIRFAGTFGGALSAFNGGVVEDSYADAVISSGSARYVGGAVGYNLDTGIITRSYALGSVTLHHGAESNLGGLEHDPLTRKRSRRL